MKSTTFVYHRILLLIGSMLFVGCSAKSSDSSAPEAPGSEQAWDKGDAGYSNDFDFDNVKEDGMSGTPNVSPIPGTVQRKFIENGNLELRSVNVDETFKALSTLAQASEVASFRTNSSSARRTNDLDAGRRPVRQADRLHGTRRRDFDED